MATIAADTIVRRNVLSDSRLHAMPVFSQYSKRINPGMNSAELPTVLSISAAKTLVT